MFSCYQRWVLGLLARKKSRVEEEKLLSIKSLFGKSDQRKTRGLEWGQTQRGCAPREQKGAFFIGGVMNTHWKVESSRSSSLLYPDIRQRGIFDYKVPIRTVMWEGVIFTMSMMREVNLLMDFAVKFGSNLLHVGAGRFWTVCYLYSHIISLRIA